MNIRKATSADAPAIMAIAASLPKWFTAGGIKSIEKDLQVQSCLVSIAGDKIAGFLIYQAEQGKGKLSWLGVAPDHHHHGMGSALVAEMKRDLQSRGVTEVFVSTLGDGVDYAPYAQTRAFYRATGFKDFEVVKHPDNPECEEELVLRAAVTA